MTFEIRKRITRPFQNRFEHHFWTILSHFRIGCSEVHEIPGSHAPHSERETELRIFVAKRVCRNLPMSHLVQSKA
eukprot:UN06610